MEANCYLDANVCIAFIQAPHQFHLQAKLLLKSIRTRNIIPTLSPLCLDETIHILLRDGSFTVAKKQIVKLLKIPNLKLINPPSNLVTQLRIFRFINKYHLKPRDAYHLLTIKHHKIKYFATFDHDFDLAFASKTLTRLKPDFPDSS